MRTIAIIQARMNSSRLPGKVLLDLGGKPMLAWVVDRALGAKRLDGAGVATTTAPSDDAIEAFCESRGYPCFRGSEFDVLDRYYQAALSFKAERIVRLTADCPVVDPALIDATIQEFESTGVDFAATRLPPPWKRTYPIGQDIEIVSFANLARAWNEATEKYEREHVMPYFYDQDGRFQIKVLNAENDYSAYRWTVDTAPDLDLLRVIIKRFGGREDFTWREVLQVFEHEPELAQINSGVVHKTGLDVDERHK
jgi:spore coat polysaccharide biosynthesis protein SpsF